MPPSPIFIVPRDELPAIHSTEVDGVTHNLGLVKDLRHHPALARFLPEHGRLGVAWVHLRANEKLSAHRHPVASMVIVVSGEAYVHGDLNASLSPGDTVCIAAGAWHGFAGGATGPFWGLSFQFAERSLYEDMHKPQVAFTPSASDALRSTLLDQNNQHAHAFADHPLFLAIRAGMYDAPSPQQKLAQYLQVWSDTFQKVLLLRSALCVDPASEAVFATHMHEELGHHTQLHHERSAGCAPWDAPLEAAAQWFVLKMANLDDMQKAFLVHGVLEKAASVFYPATQKVLAHEAMHHVALHVADDPLHEQMGLALLEGLTPKTFAQLQQLAEHGWAMMRVMLDRMHVLCTASTP